ncbi:hypothetical protein JTE90_022825 [Oedothorax gibbosus]|uniref:TIR domain-containing protein n=1 Tax=Oedothorax gibbosus TaxID=931172 RepID=A0AAV6V8C3_9ARAC|nr:hypothetical protein JTE90_022825 [Oedothorax gibbosus]
MAFSNASIYSITSTCPLKTIADNWLNSDDDSLKELHLRSTKFLKIPSGIGDLRHLKILDMSGGNLLKIADEIRNMTGLVKLYFQTNHIFRISMDAFFGNPDLKVIDLSQNDITFLEPGTFDSCQKLEKIYLQKNKIQSSVGLFGISTLQEINLSENNLTTFEGVFQNEIELQTLDLGKNNIREIKEDFGKNIKRLKFLILDACDLVQLPPTLFRYLPELQEINLKFNKLEDIPPGLFHNLGSLVVLDLSKNRIQSLKGAFLYNDMLRKIDLSENLIEKCGDMFHDMQSLESVDLTQNHLQVIENDDFSYAPLLTDLLLGNNVINRLDSNAFVDLRHLRQLNLHENFIYSLNRSVRDLPGLQELHLHNNKLKNIDAKEMENLQNLKRLNLANNELESVQGAFRNLHSMESLTIHSNQLKTLTRSSFPEAFKVQNLYLSGNKFACDCRLSWLRDWMTTKSLHTKNVFRTFKCDSPEEFSKRTLTQLKARDLSIWTKKCDPACECKCVAEDVGYHVRVDCSNRGLTEAPPVLPDAIGELLLQNNLLTSPTKLDLSTSTQLKELNLENNKLTVMDIHLPSNIQTLMLANNSIIRFRPPYVQENITWTLSGNPWTCDCDAVGFWKFVTSQDSRVLDRNSTRCSDNRNLQETRGRLLIELTEIDMCPPSLVILYASLSTALVALAILSIVFHFGFRRYQYHIKVWFYSQGVHWIKKDYDCPGLIDVYLAFDDKDANPVKKHILPGFEKLGREGYSIYFPQKYGVAGDFKFQQDTQMASNCKRIIFLLSPNYIANGQAMALFRAMHAMCLKEQMYRIILVFLTKIPELSDVDLKTAMEATKCLHVGDKLFWDSIRFRMPPLPKKSHQNEDLDYSAVSDNIPLLCDEPDSHCEDSSNNSHILSMIQKTNFAVDRNKEDDDDLLLLHDEPEGLQYEDSRRVHGPTLHQNFDSKGEGHNLHATCIKENIHGRNKDFRDSKLQLIDEPGSPISVHNQQSTSAAVRPNPF